MTKSDLISEILAAEPDLLIEPLSATSESVYLKIMKYTHGEWKKIYLSVDKGQMVGKITTKGDFRTNYILDDIQEVKLKRSEVDKHLVTRKKWRVIFKHKDSGKILEKHISEN